MPENIHWLVFREREELDQYMQGTI